MKKSIPVQVSLPPNTHEKLLDYALHIGCITIHEKPKAATAIWKTLKMILEFYRDENIMNIVQNESGDLLDYIKKCVKNDIKQK